MRSQDEVEFRAFVETRRAALVRTAYLVCGDRDEAEDLTQIALLKLHPAWHRAKAARNRDAYVRRVLVNAYLSRVRRRRVTQFLTDRVPERAGLDSTAGLADRSVLMAALTRLPAGRRATVVLRYWEDLPEAEVARILGCSVGTVRSQAFKGLAELREDPQLVGLFRSGSTPATQEMEARR